MSAENQSKPTPGDAHPGQTDEHRPVTAQDRRDEEIEAIQQHSRHQHPGIEKPPEVPPAPPRKALMMLGVALLVLLVAGGLTLFDHVSHERALAKETERETVPTVAVVYPLSEKPDEDLVLPGSLLAYEESPIYARTNGYLVRWYKDIGSRITKGELLAKIDTPEVDQELNQTRAARLQILAQMDLAKISADRWENLRKTDSVSAQETDQYDISRVRQTWPLPTPMCAASNSLRASRTSTRRFPVCSHGAMLIPARSSTLAQAPPDGSCLTLRGSILCAFTPAFRKLTHPI
jgi:hypothetical protein